MTTGVSRNETVQLQDQFDTAPEFRQVLEAIRFANPVQKSHDGIITPITNPDSHLKFYALAPTAVAAPQRLVTVSNQFGQQVLTVQNSINLAVPTQKLPHGPFHDLDHFKCYQASGSPVNQVVDLLDQFHFEPQVTVIQPVGFCNPVMKIHNGMITPIDHPADHLVLYEITPQPFTTTVQTINQFGNETTNIQPANILGVPSLKLAVVIPTPTATPTNTPTATPTPGFEGDVAPRPNGDGVVLATDVTQLRRFATGLDTPGAGTNEGQRADIAPRASFGDGTINAGDVVQGRRYATGLDPLTGAGGPPTAPSIIGEGISAIFDDLYAYFFGRDMRIGATENVAGRTVIVPVELTSYGDEVAMGFTLEYDSARFSNPQVALGEFAPEGSVLTVNSKENGRIGILVDSTKAMVASAIPKRMVIITFECADGQPFRNEPLGLVGKQLISKVCRAR